MNTTQELHISIEIDGNDVDERNYLDQFEATTTNIDQLADELLAHLTADTDNASTIEVFVCDPAVSYTAGATRRWERA